MRYTKVKTTAKLSDKKGKASVVLIVFKGAIYDVKVYSVTVSFCRSTLIRYQKCFIISMT